MLSGALCIGFGARGKSESPEDVVAREAGRETRAGREGTLALEMLGYHVMIQGTEKVLPAPRTFHKQDLENSLM